MLTIPCDFHIKLPGRIICTGIYLLALFSPACKKKDIPLKSSSKEITSFKFYKNDNPALALDLPARISNDTIYIELPAGTDITQLVPTITYSGFSLSPGSKIVQDFSSAILYKVTAEDGSTRTYKTFTRYLSSSKQITSFTLEKTRNSSLNADITGVISGDSIMIDLPPGINTSSIIPAIVYTGASVYPANYQPASFTYPAHYTVTAEDGSSKTYTVFAGSNKYIIAQAEDGYLYNIDAKSGSVLWKHFSGGPGNYTFHNGVVFFSGNDNTVYALNIADGSVKWTSSPPRGIFNLTSPVVRKGKVLFGGSGMLTYPNSDYLYKCDFIYAINEETGSQEWLTTFSIDNTDGYSLLNVAADENIICAYDALGGIFTFGITNGNALWNLRGDLLGRANPVILDNVIYYTNELGLRAVTANTGTPVWQLKKCYSSPTVNGNIIYSLGGESLFAMDLQTGSDIWQAGNVNNRFSVPYVNNNSVFTALSNHYLLSYNATTGEQNWQKEGFNGQYLVAADNDLYVCDVNNKLNCLDAATGNPKWKALNLPDFIKAFFIVNNQSILFHVVDSGERN